MMNRLLLNGIFSLVLLSCILALTPGCCRETEQEKIKKVITGVQQAAQDKDVKKIISSFSKTYKDPQGYDYDAITTLLVGYFIRHQTVHVYITNLRIVVHDGAAEAAFQAVLSGGNKAETDVEILPEALGIYVFDVLFRKEERVWKIGSAKWDPVGTDEVRGGH